MAAVWPAGDVRWRRLESILLAVGVALLAYSVLVWRHVLGDGTELQPFRMVVLSACLVLQSLVPFARRRSPSLFYVAFAASLAMLGYLVLTR